MMTNQEIKSMSIEIDNLRNQLYKYHNILDKTINWLDGEVTESQEVIDEYMKDERPKCTDGTDDMIEGRYECANSLLEQIQKWENEES